MTVLDSPRWLPGRSIVVAKVPAAEAVVAAVRLRYDESARAGMPAHITVFSPFLPAGRLTPDVLDELGRLVARHRAFDVTFAGLGRFPVALWLAPEPPQPLRSLTELLRCGHRSSDGL
ncbi:2'-5' RNA ligase family protein [Streptomyces flavofungini]|uniref:2'-5' RNA ligase family protein n=1 Tax=Streptomyces flavofungini TaxID=68200 RepID=A0ABS0XJA3_9ACTN|nr:2'-5' RNA ligase family protein [Streptomyces flavofungini]